MIGLQTFTNEFDRIAASFSRSMTTKQVDSWYEEIKYRDPALFKKACHKLSYGEKFPNFAAFRAAYQEVKTSSEIGDVVKDSGCGWCHDKLVIYEKGDYTYSGKCKFCYDVGEPRVLDPMSIDKNESLNLVKPSSGPAKYIPRDALQELLGQVSIGGVVEDEPNEKIRQRNLARDRARDAA